ncbi:arylacetamide deacetylase-like isoform X1 [Anguilla anguilla]|uniref:arylacetamide deacetylase-like isoform X1 n=1 Tax=Anguilla anguilla TaxID=7936 RepID=UPI0015A7BFD6|nr:arylacetamide deacetylase-like isoform X1 [Anguilla anguilla]
MRSNCTIAFLLVVIGAYYVYLPIPGEIEQKWKLMITDSFFRSLSHLADFSELLGLKDYMGVMMLITVMETVAPATDRRVRVTEEVFDGVDVVVYRPGQQGGSRELRRAVIYLHGGGWCLGSSRMEPYDLLARKMVVELNAVVISVEYRLAPAHPFPAPFEDVYRGVRYFLRDRVLARYSVDPTRIAVSGDSAGGNLAAAVAQKLQQEPGQQVALKAQALLYPVLQALDLNTPSYRQNQDMPILPRTLMVRFWSEYFTSDKTLFHAMMTNSHNRPEDAHLLKFVNWSSHLPESFRGAYRYSAPEAAAAAGAAAEVPVSAPTGADPSGPFRAVADPRASPLLAQDGGLRLLPKAYILTCEYDVLRDDGVMYATRLRGAGVNVTHRHYAAGFHGALMFTVWPADFQIAHRMTEDYVSWLRENL